MKLSQAEIAEALEEHEAIEEIDSLTEFVTAQAVIDACAERFVRITQEQAIKLIADHPGCTAKQIGAEVGFIADWGDPLAEPDWHAEMDCDHHEIYEAL